MKDHETEVRKKAKAITAFDASNNVSVTPLPVGYSTGSDPYFAPPVNLPPLPVGYTELGAPFFDKTPSIKPLPAGVSLMGTRFYNKTSKIPSDAGVRNQIAGYDYNGFPFFLPRGCSIPSPAGFTVDGIPYYDIPTIMQQRGILLLQTSTPTTEWSSDYIGNATLASQSIENNRAMTMNLVQSLSTTQSLRRRTFIQRRKNLIGKIKRVPEFEKLRELLEKTEEDFSQAFSWNVPKDVVDFFREHEDLTNFRPTPMKLSIEPSSIEFQGVKTPVSKNVLFKWRSARGDHQERDFFVAIEPVDVFSVKIFHLKLQAEGVIEVLITYFPNAMKSDSVHGMLCLIDEFGKKLATCNLFALRQSFIKVTPLSIDAGWILPEKRKECVLRLENGTRGIISLKIGLRSDVKEEGSPVLLPASSFTSDSSALSRQKPSAFTIPTKNLTLQSLENRFVTFLFEPSCLGPFSDVLEVRAPGGDIIEVQVHGTAGIPIALYPEDEESSKVGAASLTKERCEFMKKFKRVESTEKAHVALNTKDMSILQSMMLATSDQDSRREAHTLEYYLCSIEEKSKTRCLTLMNLSDQPLTVGLYSHSPCVKCPYLIRIAPRMAHSVEITLEITEASQLKNGKFSTVVEIVCPDFQNIELHVRGFVGQPLYIPCWDIAYFKPCVRGVTEELEMCLINESHFDLSFIVEMENKEDYNDMSANSISCSLSSDPDKPTMISADSTRPIVFSFSARERGPFLQTVFFKVLKPFSATIPAALLSKPLRLAGICIEPYLHKPGEVPDKNGIDFIRTWISHPKRVIDEYPAFDEKSKRFDTTPTSKPSTGVRRDIQSEVQFKKEMILFRANQRSKNNSFMDSRRSSSQTVQLQHRGKETVQCLFFGSTYLNADPRAQKVNVGDDLNIEIVSLPPPDFPDYLTTFGFAIALQEHDHKFHAIQVISKYSTDFLLYPSPNSEGSIILDFGNVEFSSVDTELTTKSIVLCNTFPVSYSWTAKIVSSKNKYSAFELGVQSGELLPFDSITLPFKLRCENSGTFESSAEIQIKESTEKGNKTTKIADVILKAQTVNTSLTGFPENIEFGSVLATHKRRRKFVLTNNGSTEAMVTILVKPPFYAEPKTIKLLPKEQYPVEVIYQPTESKTSIGKMLVFTNHKLYSVQLSGTGGTAELICEKYDKKEVDYGEQREGTIAWTSIYLTNKGTFPIALRGVSASSPDLVKLYYLDCTNSVPYEVATPNTLESLNVRRDYWSAVRRKVKIFSILRLLQRSVSLKSYISSARRTGGFKAEDGQPIRVFKKATTNFSENSMQTAVPPLKPFFSYHFRLGYSSRYQLKTKTDLIFHYLPLTSDDELSNIQSMVTAMSLNVTGYPYRPLEFFPPSFDFGIWPAEDFIEMQGASAYRSSSNNSYGMAKNEGIENSQQQGLYIQILNMSLEVQNFTLQSIPPEFLINGRTWNVLAGEKLLLPVEFHPPKEQVQYRGEAKFIHKHGTASISLAGTGASAEVFAEDTLDFGSIKFGSVSSLPLKIINRGLLASKFTLEIIQDGENLRFENDDPYEYEGVIESGSTLEMNIKCECKTVLETTPIVAVRWARVPGGQIEQIIVPIHVKIGIPHFKLKVQEVDFRTTYIKVNRTVEVKVLNDGNANCSWTAVSESPVLHLITPTSGIIEPGQSTTLRIQFAPIDYDILQSSISFVTDAGRRLLMCYGSVGVPYLQIPQDMLITDFDIVEINRTHIKPFNITNSGKKSIEYDIVITDLKQDGIDIPSSMFDVFTVEPSHHVVGPGETFSAQLKCVPKDYNAIYTAQILASTRDGEEYSGKVSAVGGKAIIKLAPPSVGITDNAVTAEVSASLPSSSEGRGNNGMTKNSHLFEAAKITYALHLENLQEVIAGLRAAELDGHLDQMEIQKLKDASTLGLNSDPEAMDAASTASMTGFPRSRGKPKPTIFDGSDLKQNIQEGLNQTDDSEEQDGSMQNRSRAILASRSARSREGGDGISMSLFYTDQLEKMEIGIENMISSASNHSFENKQQQKRGVATPDSSKNAFGRYLPGTPRGRSKLQSPSKETASTSSAGSSSVNNSFGWKAVSPDRHDRKFRPPSSLTARSAVAKQLVALTEPIQFMTDDIKLKISETEMEVNPVQQKSLISKVNDTILDHTQAVLFGLKEKLNSGWVPNREVLTTALRRLQVSNRMVEELLENEKNRDIKDESDFALGIFKSGEKSNTILLFNLPNTGNLSFDYELRLLQDSIVFPPSFDLKDSTKVELFKISPQTGTVSPKESVNISASFQGSVPGLYRQGYALVSSDEVISKFTVSVNVGEPKLVLNPMFVDFGMVMCGKSSTSTVSLSNIGTFKDNWLIKSDSKTLGNMPVVLVNEMSRKVPFGFDTIRGLLPQGADTPIQITFKPAELGNYEQTYQISWNQEPILFNVKGVGGASKIKPIFIDERDKIFVGLDFGRTCVVGLSYKRSFQLMNIGNVEGEFELIASHEAFSLDVTRDSNGKVRIMPNATLDVHVTFSPVKTVDLNENFQIRIPDKNPQSIPIKGYAGVCDWNVDGVVDFHNMPINSSQTRLITIANIGDLEFPVLLKLEPDTIDPFITIEYENVVGPDFVLSAGVSTTIKVTFDSENDQKVDGNITLKTNHGAEDKFIKYPFNFRVYEKQVAFDLQDDINIGRILVGESSSINRNLTNYGTKDVKYRSRVLPSTESGEIKPGESKFGTPWRLLTATGIKVSILMVVGTAIFKNYSLVIMFILLFYRWNTISWGFNQCGYNL